MVEEACLAYRLQTYAAKELVIVNDGEPIRAAADDVSVVNLAERRSVGSKRNAGIAAARGELVAIWDDDDFSLPERLAEQVALAERTGADHVRSSRMWVADEALEVRALVEAWCLPTSLIRRAAVLAVGGFPDEDYAEDLHLHERLVEAGFAAHASAEPLYVHRRHGANASRSAGESLASMLAWSVPVDPADLAAAARRVAELRATGSREPCFHAASAPTT